MSHLVNLFHKIHALNWCHPSSNLSGITGAVSGTDVAFDVDFDVDVCVRSAWGEFCYRYHLSIFPSFLRFFQFLCSISNKILCSCFTLLTLALTNLISPLSLYLYFYSILFKKIKTNTLSPFLPLSLSNYPFSDSCSFRHFFLLLSFLLLWEAKYLKEFPIFWSTKQNKWKQNKNKTKQM